MQIREIAKYKIQTILFSDSELPESDILKITDIIENSCNNANIDIAYSRNMRSVWENNKFVQQYSNILYKILTNIDPASNVNKTAKSRLVITKIYNYWFIKKLKKIAPDSVLEIVKKFYPSLDIKKIGYMTSNELNPEINKKYIKELELRNKQAISVKTTKMYKCPFCQARDAKYYRKQTRSGDEGYTLFINCIQCNQSWTMQG